MSEFSNFSVILQIFQWCLKAKFQIPPLRSVMFAVNTTTRAASRPPRFMVVYSFPIVNLPRREENTEELGNVFQFRKIYHFISNRRHLSEIACDVMAHNQLGYHYVKCTLVLQTTHFLATTLFDWYFLATTVFDWRKTSVWKNRGV